MLIPFFQQFTGINTIMFYATQLFAVLGQSGDAALLSTAIVGAVNVGSTIIAIVLVDRSVCVSILLLLLMHGSSAVLHLLYVLHVHCQAAIQLVECIAVCTHGCILYQQCCGVI